MAPSPSLPGFRESARDLPGVCQALAESRKAQCLASKIFHGFVGRLGKTEQFRTWKDLGRPGMRKYLKDWERQRTPLGASPQKK